MWIAWALALPALIAIVVKLVRPDRPMLIPGRAAVFLLVTILLSAVVLTNLTFKSYWGRPRPVMVTEFNGPWQFVPWWDPRGECGRNCSFFSGEGATAFWTYAPAALAPPAWRPLAYVGGDRVRGRHLRAADGVRRALLYRRRRRGPRELFRDLARPCLDLPLAVDPAGRTSKSRPRWRAGAGPATGCCSAGAGATVGVSRSQPPGAIKRVPTGAKFDIRALKAANRHPPFRPIGSSMSTILKSLPKGEKVGIAFSGGLDTSQRRCSG